MESIWVMCRVFKTTAWLLIRSQESNFTIRQFSMNISSNSFLFPLWCNFNPDVNFESAKTTKKRSYSTLLQFHERVRSRTMEVCYVGRYGVLDCYFMERWRSISFESALSPNQLMDTFCPIKTALKYVVQGQFLRFKPPQNSPHAPAVENILLLTYLQHAVWKPLSYSVCFSFYN